MSEAGESRYRLQAVLDTAVDGIIPIDESGIIQSANPAVGKLFGFAASELIGENVSILMPSGHREQHDEYIARYMATGEGRIIGIGRELQAVRRDGYIFPIELAVSEVPGNGIAISPASSVTLVRVNEQRRLCARARLGSKPFWTLQWTAS